MSLRIISGERRGTKLAAPEGMDTRPLRDRVRESLFNIIRPSLREARVLDAFAGSGAVGLEALSNGAAHATLVDPGQRAVACIHRNIEKLRYEDRTLVIQGASPRSVERNRLIREPFSLIFLMPPYHSGLCVPVLESKNMRRLYAEGSLAVCEIHKDETLEAQGWSIEDERLYGVTKLVFLR